MIGIDVVDVARFERMVLRSPAVQRRLFTAREIAYCSSKPDASVRFAGTLAAKEAVIKALGLGPLVVWARRIEIERRRGAPIALVEELGEVEVSISHDGGVAAAVAISPFAPRGLRTPVAARR
ncbi:MAG: holo-ACP synthase [Actinomycetota bacterium]